MNLRFLEKYFLLRIFDWRFLFSPDINFILRSLSGSYYRNASVRKYSPSLPFFFFLCHNFLFNTFLYLIFLHVKYLEDICHSILLWKLRIYQLYYALFYVCVSRFFLISLQLLLLIQICQNFILYNYFCLDLYRIMKRHKEIKVTLKPQDILLCKIAKLIRRCFLK